MTRTRATDILAIVLLSAFVALPATLAWDIAAGTGVQASPGVQCTSPPSSSSASGVDVTAVLAATGREG